MSTPDRGALRLVRSLVLAGFVLGLSAGGHVLAGGRLSSGGALVATVLAVAVVTTVVTRWRLSRAALVGLSTAGQLVLHEVFTAPAARHAQHAQHVAHVAHPHDALGAGDMTTGGVSGEVTMLAAHLVVAVALALVFSDGEDAVWALCAWLVPLRVVLAVLGAPAVTAGPRAAPTGSSPSSWQRWELLRTVCRRGPPGALAA